MLFHNIVCVCVCAKLVSSPSLPLPLLFPLLAMVRFSPDKSLANWYQALSRIRHNLMVDDDFVHRCLTTFFDSLRDAQQIHDTIATVNVNDPAILDVMRSLLNSKAFYTRLRGADLLL